MLYFRLRGTRTSKRAGGEKVGGAEKAVGGEKGAGESATKAAAVCGAPNMIWPLEARKRCIRPRCCPLGASNERSRLSGGVATGGLIFSGAGGARLISAAGADGVAGESGASLILDCCLAFSAIAYSARSVKRVTCGKRRHKILRKNTLKYFSSIIWLKH